MTFDTINGKNIKSNRNIYVCIETIYFILKFKLIFWKKNRKGVKESHIHGKNGFTEISKNLAT